MVMLPQYERHVLGWHQLRGIVYAAQRNHTPNTNEPMFLNTTRALTSIVSCFISCMMIMSKLYFGVGESR